MKALFLFFYELNPYNGICKKVLYQQEAFKKNGLDMRLCQMSFAKNGDQLRMVEGEVIKNFGHGFMAKLRNRYDFRAVSKYIRDNEIEYLYIRSAHNANPFLNRMLKKINKLGVVVDLEIPTYPYEGQFKGAGVVNNAMLLIDKLFRNAMAKYLHRIITFSDDREIFGCKTINISNAIDFDTIKVKSRINDTSASINLLSVAEIHFWHGLDRLIEGMSRYYNYNPDEEENSLVAQTGRNSISDKKESGPLREVLFHVVGKGYVVEYEQLRALVKERGLEDKVLFYGNLSGEELDTAFERADFGIASLGRHRSGITRLKSLKAREYAARGIPFIYSEIDDDFEHMPYVIKAPADDSPIDIQMILNFYDSLKMTPAQIRATIEKTLSWEVQMKRVVGELLIH
jgi:glycosyltransferase involved in cell wall biosynthesis